MNKTLIQNWNKKVSDSDEIYIFGDVTMTGPKHATEILKQLNGIKYLVKGNHDKFIEHETFDASLFKMKIEQTRKRWQIALAIAMVASGIAGVRLSVHDQGLEIFDAYTENSNIFNLMSSSIYLLYLIGALPIKTKRGVKFIKQLRYLSTCCLALTFIVVLFVLAPMDGISGYKEWFFSRSMFFNHLLTPALSLVSFIVLEKEPILPQKDSWYALIPTLLYATITITLNALGVLDGPYPFLRVRNQSVITSILWIVIIFSVNYILSAIVLRLNRKA